MPREYLTELYSRGKDQPILIFPGSSKTLEQPALCRIDSIRLLDHDSVHLATAPEESGVFDRVTGGSVGLVMELHD
jgi:hypothetical protein